MSCEDQALVPTKVCTRFNCQTWLHGESTPHRPTLVLRGRFWCCPICGGSYGTNPHPDCPPARVPKERLNIRPYTNALREYFGTYIKEFDSVAGGVRCVQFRIDVDANRSLRVQLWGDGCHRVSMSWKRREATMPTDFVDVDSMYRALRFERNREPNLRPIQRVLPMPGGR